MNFITSFCRKSYLRLGPTQKVMFWIGFIALVTGFIGGVFGFLSWWNGRDAATNKGIEGIITKLDTMSKDHFSELEKRFPGGFETLGVLTGGGAYPGHIIIRSSTSHSFDITWGNGTITELTPGSLTLHLQNLKIIRTETTPDGTQQAELNLNGAAVWRIDRGTKRVYINNAISFWGYVLGGYVLLDTNDVLFVAIGLQRLE